MIVLCDEVTCAVCGHTGQLPSIGHWEAEGPWGLDNRPPEPMLSHLALLVQACPDCGYCAGDVGMAEDGVADIVRGETYQTLRHRSDVPGDCLHFLLQGHIAKTQGNAMDAAWAHIHAAWLFESQGDDVRSCEHRLVAADLMRSEMLGNLDGFKEPGAVWLLRCDLLRRAGCLEEARGVALVGLAIGPSKELETDLRYELTLIDDGDRSFRDFWDARGRPESAMTFHPSVLDLTRAATVLDKIGQ